MKTTIKKRLLLIIGGIAALCVIGTAVIFSLNGGPDSHEPGSQTPLGALFGRASAVSRLKEQMGDLRAFHPALMEFARAHEDDLPRSIAELRPYLPKKLAYLEDGHWELPSTGKFSSLVSATGANELKLLQEKQTGKPRIIVYADGHIEYKN